MRILPLAIALAIGATSSSVLSQVQRKDGGSGTVKGQAEQPANPKQLDPESFSHNAEKPKTAAPPASKAVPKKAEPDPAKKK
jgi:hypothetical protein